MTQPSPLGTTEVLKPDFFLDILDRLPQAVLILSGSGHVRFWSAGAEALFGWRASEMIGQDTERLLPHERAVTGETGRLFDHARAGGHLREFETERLTRDGRTISVLLTQSPIRSAEGGFEGLLVVLTDITEHRRLLGAIKSRVHQLSIIKEIGEALHGTMDLEEVLHLILIGVTAGPGLRFNRAILLLCDETGSRLQGRLAIGPANGEEARRIWDDLSRQPKTLREMLGTYERSIAQTNASLNRIIQGVVIPIEHEASLVTRAIRTGTAVTLPSQELCPLDQDLARLLETATFAVAPLSARGRTIGALIADNGITRREIQADDLEMLQLLAATASIAIDNSRLYAELAQRLALLQAARSDAYRSRQAVVRAERLSVIGEMAATVAHDIRNPLTAIGGFARALLNGSDSSDPRREYLDIIVEEVARLEGIVTKVLDSARPATPETQSVQINRIVEEAVKLIGREIEENRVHVTLRLDPGLPPVSADSDRVFEMVLNLLRNAIQAMSRGGSLSILSIPAGDTVEIRFIDSGPGVPDEIRGRIFSPFFTTKPSGTGLGLAIVKQVLQEHGGTLDLQSTAGAGSTFIVKLPIKSEAPHDQAPRS